MISISAGHSVDYLTEQVATGRENYYTGAVAAGEPPGTWWGRGAELLGLTGAVDAQDMTALYEHRLDPRDDRFRQPSEWGQVATLGAPLRRYATSEELYERMLAAEANASGERREELRLNAERSARRNVQFLDVTFSAPKSVTVLAVAFERQAVDAQLAGDADATAAWLAHRDAVEAAVLAGNQAMLGYLQDVAGYSRVGHHGGAAGRYVDAHDWTVASFLQHDSRDHDPQLHVHNAILNRVQCPDGKWRTIATKAIYAYRPAAGALAERVMEEHLTRALGIRFATRPDGKAREVVGVAPEVMDLFSSRRRAITDRTAGWVAEFRSHHGREPNALELDRLQRRATLATRRAKSALGETAAERLDRWDAELRAEVAGGLAGVARDVLGLVDRQQQAAPWSPIAVVETALADVQATKSSWTEADLLAAIGRALPDGLGGLDPASVRTLLEELTQQGLGQAGVQQVAGEVDADRPAVPELLLASGASTYTAPASSRYATLGQLVTEHGLRRAAVQRGAPVIDIADEVVVERLRAVGLVLSPSQEQALLGVLRSGAKVETLVGPAGSGKSTVVGALARLWTDPDTWQRPTTPAIRPKVVGLASSQFATDVLRDEGLPAMNVARWLATQRRIAAGGGDPVWKLTAGDLVVIDEAAMLSTADLAAVHAYVAAAGAKLLLTGDHRQLAAVGAGGAMALLAKAGAHELVDVQRFSAEWERSASVRLRDGDEAVLMEYRKRGRLLDGGTPEQASVSARQAWLADVLAGRRSVLIVSSNETASRLSAEVRVELVRLGRVVEEGVALGRDGTVAGVGDLVQARRNAWELAGLPGNTKAPINRETYRVLATHEDGGLTVETLDGGEILTMPGRYVAADVTLAYAGTVHSTQGRTVDTAHMLVDSRTSQQALYVGLTRGRHGNYAHVVTHAVGEDRSPGEAHSIARRDPLSVLAEVVGREPDPVTDAAVAQAEEDERRRVSVQTAIERFAAEAEMVYMARTVSALDRLTAAGALSADQRLTFAAEATDTRSLARLLRTTELAGHDPDLVLESAVRSRDFDGARSLPQVLYRRIERQLAGRLAPSAWDFADMVPAAPSAAWRAQLSARAEAADSRRQQLGADAAEDPPQWAVEALGPVPEPPVGRLDWEHRAGRVAAWRELSGHSDSADALGTAPRQGKPEHYAAWRMAWTALGRPEADRAEAELTDGQLRLRIRAYQREEAWAPAYVGESLTATSLAADARRRRAVLTAARADATPEPAEAAQLAEEAAEQAALADTLGVRVAELTEADDARARWLLHTAVTRDAAQRAEAELVTRGVPVGAEAEDAVTAEEWLAALRSDQAESDAGRQITAEHELADIAAMRSADARSLPALAAETVLLDARGTGYEDVIDEPGRVPTADESRAAVRRAQAALAAIEQRRSLDERQAQEERRATQLSHWAAEDAQAASDEYTDARW